ncbi:ABC transporter permease subunit [Bacteriovorax sp. PP10]|uniref:ABC transporter permease subunit n=1 Tax=Bacteriovorax antarcticus TaxID=3088717 RepID=A0ABU5VNP4_9BACT|nr:ABC transporter permease subunit [Bacteriovorax sp. PP10]MEA9354663.1 ABC transporter permease subunit [Bacteriovorax sp. PP10]
MKLLTIAKFTFLEVYRSKLMLGLVFLGFGLSLITYVASEFAYGASAKVALDVGLGIMSLSNLAIAIFIGSTLLSKEIEQRTLYMILSRPISRTSFLLGKILGLSSVLLLNTLILGILSIFLFMQQGGTGQALFPWVLLFSFFEALIILVFAVFFSLITNVTLSVICTFAICVTGHALNETSRLILVKLSPVLKLIIDTCFFFIPNLYKLNLKDFLLYQQTIDLNYLVMTQAYALLYLTAMFALIMLLFKNKNLD